MQVQGLLEQVLLKPNFLHGIPIYSLSSLKMVGGKSRAF